MTNDVKVGSLVKIRPAIASPSLYGIGLVVKVEGERCFVRWSELPDRPLRGCAAYALEVISESR
jgi:hypothetical protein